MLQIAPGWNLRVERGPDWLLVRVNLTTDDIWETPPLADRVWSLMQQHFAHRVLLELDEVKMLDSRLLGQLIKLYRQVHAAGGMMRLSGLSPYNREVLHQCRLDDRFHPSYHDRGEAVLGCCPRKPR